MPDVTTPARCPKCDTPVGPGSRFCVNCGLDVSDPSGGTTVGVEVRDNLLELTQEAVKGVYEIERELGRGGMAAVFLATEIELRRRVAIKVLPPEFSFGPGMIERFQREARTSAQLDHPNIIPIYRVGTAGRLLYFAMKYVEGRSLADILHERGALPIPTVTGVLEAVAAALAYAHERGVVHRDIKPANILIDRQGVVLVSDFGIARASSEATLTASGAVVGTPQYMSPEQCKGERVGPASDQYSLGVVGYQMLAGHVPFDAPSAIALLQLHVLEAPPPLVQARPDAPADLVRAVERTLRKTEAERFPTTADFAEAIEMISIAQQHAPEGRAQIRALAQGKTISGLKVVTPISGPSKIRKPRRRWTLPAAIATTTVAAGIVLVVLLGKGSPPTQIQQPPSQSPSKPETTVVATQPAATPPSQQATPVHQETTPVRQQAPSPRQQASSARQQAAATQPQPSAPRPSPATLVLENLPPAASVSVDGADVQGGSATLTPGPHTVVIAAAGYETFSQTISLADGERRSFRAALVPIPQEPGTLSVGSRPAGTLFIDGTSVGELPVRNRQIPAGPRRLRIEAPGYAPFDTVITVAPGARVNLGMIALRPEGG